jgi:large subunit ribosomal protein L18Ae
MGKETKPQYSLKKIYQYLIVGRGKPTEKVTEPKVYRMRIFAPNVVVAKSRFWSFMNKQKKMKHANGELVAVHQVIFSPNSIDH